MIASPNDNKEIKDYNIIEDSNILHFNNQVITSLQNGWLLYGFPFIGDGYIYQTLVKYKDIQDSINKNIDSNQHEIIKKLIHDEVKKQLDAYQEIRVKAWKDGGLTK